MNPPGSDPAMLGLASSPVVARSSVVGGARGRARAASGSPAWAMQRRFEEQLSQLRAKIRSRSRTGSVTSDAFNSSGGSALQSPMATVNRAGTLGVASPALSSRATAASVSEPISAAASAAPSSPKATTAAAGVTSPYASDPRPPGYTGARYTHASSVRPTPAPAQADGSSALGSTARALSEAAPEHTSAATGGSYQPTTSLYSSASRSIAARKYRSQSPSAVLQHEPSFDALSSCIITSRSACPDGLAMVMHHQHQHQRSRSASTTSTQRQQHALLSTSPYAAPVPFLGSRGSNNKPNTRRSRSSTSTSHAARSSSPYGATSFVSAAESVVTYGYGRAQSVVSVGTRASANTSRTCSGGAGGGTGRGRSPSLRLVPVPESLAGIVRGLKRELDHDSCSSSSSFNAGVGAGDGGAATAMARARHVDAADDDYDYPTNRSASFGSPLKPQRLSYLSSSSLSASPNASSAPASLASPTASLSASAAAHHHLALPAVLEESQHDMVDGGDGDIDVHPNAEDEKSDDGGDDVGDDDLSMAALRREARLREKAHAEARRRLGLSAGPVNASSASAAASDVMERPNGTSHTTSTSAAGNTENDNDDDVASVAASSMCSRDSDDTDLLLSGDDAFLHWVRSRQRATEAKLAQQRMAVRNNGAADDGDDDEKGTSIVRASTNSILPLSTALATVTEQHLSSLDHRHNNPGEEIGDTSMSLLQQRRVLQSYESRLASLDTLSMSGSPTSAAASSSSNLQPTATASNTSNSSSGPRSVRFDMNELSLPSSTHHLQLPLEHPTLVMRGTATSHSRRSVADHAEVDDDGIDGLGLAAGAGIGVGGSDDVHAMMRISWDGAQKQPQQQQLMLAPSAPASSATSLPSRSNSNLRSFLDFAFSYTHLQGGGNGSGSGAAAAVPGAVSMAAGAGLHSGFADDGSATASQSSTASSGAAAAGLSPPPLSSYGRSSAAVPSPLAPSSSSALPVPEPHGGYAASSDRQSSSGSGGTGMEWAEQPTVYAYVPGRYHHLHQQQQPGVHTAPWSPSTHAVASPVPVQQLQRQQAQAHDNDSDVEEPTPMPLSAPSLRQAAAASSSERPFTTTTTNTAGTVGAGARAAFNSPSTTRPRQLSRRTGDEHAVDGARASATAGSDGGSRLTWHGRSPMKQPIPTAAAPVTPSSASSRAAVAASAAGASTPLPDSVASSLAHVLTSPPPTAAHTDNVESPSDHRFGGGLQQQQQYASVASGNAGSGASAWHTYSFGRSPDQREARRSSSSSTVAAAEGPADRHRWSVPVQHQAASQPGGAHTPTYRLLSNARQRNDAAENEDDAAAGADRWLSGIPTPVSSHQRHEQARGSPSPSVSVSPSASTAQAGAPSPAVVRNLADRFLEAVAANGIIDDDGTYDGGARRTAARGGDPHADAHHHHRGVARSLRFDDDDDDEGDDDDEDPGFGLQGKLASAASRPAQRSSSLPRPISPPRAARGVFNSPSLKAPVSRVAPGMAAAAV